MTWTRCVVLALLLALGGLAGGAPLSADDAPGGAAPESTLDRALSALRVRMQAKLKEAELLEKAGRLDEALAATRDVERMYREGVAELERLLVAAGGAAPGARHPGIPSPGPGAPGPRAPSAPPAPGPVPVPLPPGADPGPLEDPDAFVPGAFPGRGGQRPSDRTADAVANGLRWLAAHQSPDGGWEAAGFDKWCDGKANTMERPDGPGKATYDTGVTGLALLAFLGAGYTNRGEHDFAKVVRQGLAYLKSVQDQEGCFGPRTSQHYVYNHACAALAMVEAYGMTESSTLKVSAQKALDFIALSRNPYFVWRYGVKPGDNDTSVLGWMTMTLRSAQLINKDHARRGKPAPLTIDEEAFDGARAWLDKMTDPDTGRVGYIGRGSGPARPQELVDRFPAEKSESMTAVGVLLRVLMGSDPARDPSIQKGAALLTRLTPVWNPHDGSIDMYYWYYGSLAAFQVGGEVWRAWSAALQRAVVASQRSEGAPCGSKGSWDPIDPWGPEGGRVFSTALMTLCCEVQFRYERAADRR